MIGMAAGCGDGQAVRYPIPGDTKIWLRADDIVGNDGDAIASWPDHNGGNTFVQATAGNKPVLKTGANGFNGHNVALFDGSDDYVGYDSTISMTGKEMSVYYVLTPSDMTLATQMVFVPNEDWGPSGFGIFFYGNGNGGLNDNALGITYTGISMATNPGLNNVRSWVSYRKDGTGWSITTSNGGSYTPADNADVFLISPKLGFSPARSGTYQAFPGKIAEIIVYNRKLTALEDSNVIANLSQRYGI